MIDPTPRSYEDVAIGLDNDTPNVLFEASLTEFQLETEPPLRNQWWRSDCPFPRKNHILLHHDNMFQSGWLDRIHIFERLANLAGYLCAELHVPSPRLMLHERHNNGASLSYNLRWSDILVLHFGYNQTIMEREEGRGSPITKKRTLELISNPPRKNLGDVSPAGKLDVGAGQERNGANRPLGLGEQQQSIRFGSFHICESERGDSQMNRIFPRIFPISYSIFYRRWLSVYAQNKFFSRSLGNFTLLLSTDEENKAYVEKILSIPDGSDTLSHIRILWLDRTIRNAVRPPIQNGQVPLRLWNYYFVFVVANEIWKRSSFELSQRREFECPDCISVRDTILGIHP
ncbi:hypothetical protein IV203_015382 [Nitzschia inconspicua]|uniref:Uncharacterized protein n=1 Tax=Nitzschia inconspicua TaxID=303405 RepID=A0A9K3LB92_9STRA|nr:hypothetical protein IV203_015382 [Nitzschia inconspicua]